MAPQKSLALCFLLLLLCSPFHVHATHDEAVAKAIREAIHRSTEHTPEELYEQKRPPSTAGGHAEPVLHRPPDVYAAGSAENHYTLHFDMTHPVAEGNPAQPARVSNWTVTAHNFTHYHRLRMLYTADPGAEKMRHIHAEKHLHKDWRVALTFRASFEEAKELVLMKDAGGAASPTSTARRTSATW